MRSKSWFFLMLLLLSSPHAWAGQGLSVKDIHTHFTQYGCNKCHSEKGGLTEDGLKQLQQGFG